MHSPEILLPDLNAALRDLYGAVQLLGDEERLKTDLRLAMRRLLLAEVLGSHSIIAVGGSQGAGKTTLLRTLYQLEQADVQWLRPNEGRGEKLPVLVLEDPAHTRVQGAVRRLRKAGDHYQTSLEEVGLDQFEAAIYDPQPDVLLPVLKVPPRYFNRANQAWLLLPGYEERDRQNKAWQELMRQALVGATACVIVTDETRMANRQQVQIVNDMLTNELRQVQPLIVISKTEGARANAARQQELRTTALQVFGLTAETGERNVICTGSDDADYIAEWLPLLKGRISELACAGGSDRKAQLQRLETVLSRDLSAVLGTIYTKSRLYFERRDGGDEGYQAVAGDCMQQFDEQRDLLRVDYQQGVARLLDEQFAGAWQHLQELLQDDHEGVINNIKDFFKKATTSQLRIEADVGTAWGKPATLMARHAKLMGELTQRRLGAPDVARDTTVQAATSAPLLQRLGYANAAQQPIAWRRPDEDDLRNLKVLLNARELDKSAQRPPVRSDAGLERAVQLLPTLTLEYARMASLMPALVGVDPDTLTPAEAGAQADLMHAAVEQLSQGVQLGQTVLRSIATVLTVDILSDGDVDVIPALLNVLHPETAGGGTAAGGAAAAIGGVGAAVVGAVAVGYLAYSAISAARAHDAKARVAAHAMLLSIRDYHQRHFVHQFDQLMDQMRHRMRQALRERFRLHEGLMEKDRLAKAMADVRALQRDMLEEIGNSGAALSLFRPEEAV